MKKNSYLRSVRPRLQRAFLSWLHENRERFQIPVQVIGRTDQCIDLGLPGISKAISVYLNRREFCVMVKRDDEYFDFLVNDDVCPPRKVQGGYVCDWEEDKEQHQVFPTPEALWGDHIFEAFLGWVNERLASARWIRLYKTWGMFGADLIQTDEDLYRWGNLTLLGSLKSLDGRRMLEPGQDSVKFWIYPINADQVSEHFEAVYSEGEGDADEDCGDQKPQ
jgi:hypothetical protein